MITLLLWEWPLWTFWVYWTVGAVLSFYFWKWASHEDRMDIQIPGLWFLCAIGWQLIGILAIFFYLLSLLLRLLSALFGKS